MVDEKRPPAEKPLVVPLTFDQALTMIATGGKPPTLGRTKKKSATSNKNVQNQKSAKACERVKRP